MQIYYELRHHIICISSPREGKFAVIHVFLYCFTITNTKLHLQSNPAGSSFEFPRVLVLLFFVLAAC